MNSKYTYIRPNADEKNALGVIVYEKWYSEDDTSDFIGEYLFKDKECTEPILKSEMLNLLDKFKIVVYRPDGTQYNLCGIGDIFNEVDENGEELPEEEWTMVEDQYYVEDEDSHFMNKLMEFGSFVGPEPADTYIAVVNDDETVNTYVEFEGDSSRAPLAFRDAKNFLKGEGPCPTVIMRSTSNDNFSSMRPISLFYNDNGFETVRFLGYFLENNRSNGSVYPSWFDIIKRLESEDVDVYSVSTLETSRYATNV